MFFQIITKIYKNLKKILVVMTSLVLMLTTGKGSWAQASKLIKQEEWSHIYLICNDFAKDKFTCDKACTYIVINPFDEVKKISDKIYSELKDHLGIEVGVNFVSGTGKEHMALLSALFKLGVGMRFVVPGEDKIEEIL